MINIIFSRFLLESKKGGDMRELTLKELNIVAGGMTWTDRRQSDNVGHAQYIDGEHVWTDYPAQDICEPAPDPEPQDGNDYCEDGGDY